MDVLSVPPSTDFEIVTLGPRRFTRHIKTGTLVMDLDDMTPGLPVTVYLYWSSIKWARQKQLAVRDFGG